MDKSSDEVWKLLSLALVAWVGLLFIPFAMFLIVLVAMIKGTVFVVIGIFGALAIIFLRWLSDKPKKWGIKDCLVYNFLDHTREKTRVITYLIVLWELITVVCFYGLVVAKDFPEEMKWTYEYILFIPSTTLTLFAYWQFPFESKRKTLGKKFRCTECEKKSRMPLVDTNTGRVDWTKPDNGYLFNEGGWLCYKHAPLVPWTPPFESIDHKSSAVMHLSN